MQGFKQLSDGRVQIGRKTFPIVKHDFRNGTTSSLEVGGDPQAGYMEILPLEELKSIRIMDLPEGFSLDIYMPSLPITPEIEGVSFKHVFGSGRGNFRIGFVYGEWNGERNLLLHSREVAAKLLLNLSECRSVSFSDDEVGTSVTCDLAIPRDVDLYQYALELDKRVHTVITETTAEPNGTDNPAEQLKPDEQGVKWWLRYVLIPLLGSAAFVALLKIFS